MAGQRARNGLGIDDAHGTGGPPDGAGIADLATGLGIEGRAIEHDRRVVHVQHARLDLVVVATHEFGGTEGGEHIEIGLDVDGAALDLAGILRAFALLLHGAPESVVVDGQVSFSDDLLRDLERESVGVVQQERDVAGQHGLAGRRQLVELDVEDGRPGVQRLTKAFFFTLRDFADEVVILRQLGIVGSHEIDHGVDHLGQHQLFDLDDVRVTDRAPHDAPEHVAAIVVRREDTVVDQERGRPRVIGQDAHRHVGTGVRAIRRTRETRRHPEQVLELARVPHRVDVLQHRQDALEARTSVDALLGQGHLRAVGELLELHEHEIPDLDETLGTTMRRTALGTVSRTLVPEDL